LTPRADAARRSGQREQGAFALVLVPIAVGIVLGVFLFPRRALPDSVPLPLADRSELVRIARADRDLAARATVEPLSSDVRTLGSALRRFHELEAHDASTVEIGKAREAIDGALHDAAVAGNGALLELRAAQLELFMTEVKRFETTGQESTELQSVAGGFVRRMRLEGWCEGRRLLVDDFQLRALFKEMWSAFLGLDRSVPFALSLDEERAIYALYLSQPHPPQAARDAAAAARRGARDAAECAAAAQAEARATEKWRLDHVEQISRIDPTYPGAYARGVANLRAGNVLAAEKAFDEWVQAHPDGPYSLRAKNFLRLAVAASPNGGP
jgi:TolA-binding protein